MPKMIYFVIGSLDGYIADEDGKFDWAVPNEEVLKFVTDQVRGVTTYLYGRRMYELMQVWENDPAAAAQSPESAEFAAVWHRAHKVVFSTTLVSTPTRNTHLLREFDPEVVSRIKHESEGDLTVDGPTLAAHAFREGLVDEVHLVLVPVIIGGGHGLYPEGVRLDLDLVDQHRFSNGMVHLRYAVRGGDVEPTE